MRMHDFDATMWHMECKRVVSMAACEGVEDYPDYPDDNGMDTLHQEAVEHE